MPFPIDEKFVVAVASSALFILEDSDRIFREREEDRKLWWEDSDPSSTPCSFRRMVCLRKLRQQETLLFGQQMVFIRRLLAEQAAVSAGFYEVVFVKAGFVTKGAGSNVFAVRNCILYTPPLSRKILQGITRAAVLKLAPQLGIEIREEEMIPQFLLECEEVFITSFERLTSPPVVPFSLV